MKRLSKNNIRISSRAFTLIEIIVASLIGAFVAIVAVTTLKAVSINSETINENIDTAAESRFICENIISDLRNLYRGRQYRDTKFVGTIEPEDDIVSLTFYTVSRANARNTQPEADVYEVQYFLAEQYDKKVFMRRVMPNPSPIAEPTGMLTAMSENIDLFDVRYFDGTDWQTEWTELRDSTPELLEITLITKPTDKIGSITKRMLVNLSSSTRWERADSDAEEQDDQQQGLEELL